jgi:hypothetical protein
MCERLDVSAPTQVLSVPGTLQSVRTLDLSEAGLTPESFTAVIQALGRAGDAFPHLEALGLNKNPKVGEGAAEVLIAALANPAFLPALCVLDLNETPIARHKDPDVRAVLIKALEERVPRVVLTTLPRA